MRGAESTTNNLIRAIKDVSAQIETHPFGELEISWQNGKPVMVKITTKYKPV